MTLAKRIKDVKEIIANSKKKEVMVMKESRTDAKFIDCYLSNQESMLGLVYSNLYDVVDTNEVEG